MTDPIIKRIKQLEQQNIKFKKLLDSTLQITNEQAAKGLDLKNELESLQFAVADLEQQKKQLEDDLNLYQNLDSQELNKLQILQKENVDIQSSLINSLNDIQRKSVEIQHLNSDDEKLKQMIVQLEMEKDKLMEEILQVKRANEENNRLACENLRLRQELAALEQGSDKNTTKNNLNGQDLISKLASLEDLKETLQNKLKASINLVTDPLNISTENTVLELQISGIEKQKQRLIKELRSSLLKAASEISKLHSDTSDGELRRLLNELDIHKAILMINLGNVREMKNAENKEKNAKIQEEALRKEKEEVKKVELDNPQNTSEPNKEYCVEYCNLTCPLIKKEPLKSQNDSCLNKQKNHGDDTNKNIEQTNCSVQEIDVRAFLNSKENITLAQPEPQPTFNDPKINPEQSDDISFPANNSEIIQEVIDMKDIQKTSDEHVEITSGEDEFDEFDQEIHDLPTVSEEEEPQGDLHTDQLRLKEEFNRLVKEKLLLLKQVQSLNNSAVNNLDTQDIVIEENIMEEPNHFRRLPLDDATNQMYVNEQQLLEQRIRELEEDNERIRKDLELMMEEAQSDCEDLAILETGVRLIREAKGSLGDHSRQ